LLKLLVVLQLPALAQPLRALEVTPLLADIALFSVIFVSGVAVFAADAIATARRRIRDALKGPP
jgi:hypothetical protein